MKNTTRAHIWPMSLVRKLAIIAATAMVVALTALPGTAYAQDTMESANLRLSVSAAAPGDTITVQGSGFRVGTEASFIYVSTITIGGVPIAGVSSVDPASGFLHDGRTTDSGLYIAQHIDIDPADTTPDGAFTADIVLPDDLPAGDHDLVVTSCWGGADESYPQDGVAPCGTEGLGGGVNDRVATASITIAEPATLSLSAMSAAPGDTITVQGSGFRVGTEASFIYVSTITIGGVPIAGVSSVDPASGFLHDGRTTDSGLYIAQHIDIDPADTTPDGAFTADIVLPDDLPAGDHYLKITSCWGGADESYPQDGHAPCGTEGLGGGVNDRVATAHVTITDGDMGPMPVGGAATGFGGTAETPVPASPVGPALMFAIVALIGVAGVHLVGRRQAQAFASD